MADREFLRITVGDEKVEVRFERFTGEDALAFRRELGMGLARAIDEWQLDVDTLAGLAWLVLRRRNPKLRFREVARQVTFGSIMADSDEIEVEDEAAEEADETAADGEAADGEDPTQETTETTDGEGKSST